MNKTLILTGWGHDEYAFAAAIALRHYRSADILGMSKRRLPEFLNEVTGYSEICITGVGLLEDPVLLEKALLNLKKSHVLIRWISALPYPDELGETIRKCLQIHINYEGLPEAVSEVFDLSTADFTPIRRKKKMTETEKLYLELLDAAMFFYRNYQDEDAYGNVIRHLAANDPHTRWSKSEQRMLEHYRRFGNRELKGKSQAMQDLLDMINRIAPHANARVFISGESGTGKETIAAMLHNKSPRRDEPFITFNCASVAPNLLESRFFGYEKGAFTGATETKAGLFEQANGGTLFLDEIGELLPEAQGLLLRVLEGGRFTRVGDREEIKVDVRLITATNKDLAAMVRDGKFREDLYHRLNVVQIHAPALRDRLEDIEEIANNEWQTRHRRKLSPEQIEALMQYDYPGNVRELINLLERAFVLDESDFSKLIADHKRMTANLRPADEATPANTPDDLESAIRRHVRKIYEKYNGNLTHTADALKIARNTLKKYLED